MNSTIAASSKRCRPRKPECAREQQQQHRADALAAGADDVVRNLADQRHTGGQPTRITASTSSHVVGHQRTARRQVLGWQDLKEARRLVESSGL